MVASIVLAAVVVDHSFTSRGRDAMMFAETIEKVATQAGLKVTVRNPNYVTCGFNLADGRTQLVHLMPIGDLLGQTVVRVSTPVTEMPAGTIPAPVAEGLLLANGSFKVGSFGVVEDGARRVLVFSHNMMLETLDSEEFRTVVATLANIGDEWEKKLGGGDKF